MDLGKWLKDRKKDVNKRWQNSVILDAVSANTKADQSRRVANNQPAQYKDQQQAIQRGDIQPQRNVASRVFDQVNPLDSGRTFATNNVFKMPGMPQSSGDQLKNLLRDRTMMVIMISLLLVRTHKNSL